MSQRWVFLSGRDTFPSGNVHCESRHWDGDVDPAFRSRPASATEVEGNEGDRWARLLPELLTEIIKRVESGEDRWPRRRSVVACACVCRQWREITTNLVGSKPQSGLITFPCSLKQVHCALLDISFCSYTDFSLFRLEAMIAVIIVLKVFSLTFATNGMSCGI
ncbi:hypothetical protein HPP92_024571 [Vanilla planifolia]|uniref:F-box domain-containing protein n=1 Tax=Vanilla planifolia TaxID=51239 RepID=A0A835PP89_VANPL|nr:hypothetical protein HPP92_024571 [Vanilla planifolia]